MKKSVEIGCASPTIAERLASYAKKVHGGAEFPIVESFAVKGRTLTVAFYPVGLQEFDPTEEFEQRLIGYRDGIEESRRRRGTGVKGVGKKSLEKLRALAAAGGWLEAGEFWRRFGSKGNRLPFLSCTAGVVESFGFCPLEVKDEPEERRTRVGYRLTDKGRALLAEEGEPRK
jgi:hypothetical protein